MLTRRKPLAALAAITATLAVAASAASASAATSAAPAVDPTVCQLFNVAMGPFGPGLFLGGASLDATLANAGSSVGCQAQPASPQQPLLPIG